MCSTPDSCTLHLIMSGEQISVAHFPSSVLKHTHSCYNRLQCGGCLTLIFKYPLTWSHARCLFLQLVSKMHTLPWISRLCSCSAAENGRTPMLSLQFFFLPPTPPPPPPPSVPFFHFMCSKQYPHPSHSNSTPSPPPPPAPCSEFFLPCLDVRFAPRRRSLGPAWRFSVPPSPTSRAPVSLKDGVGSRAPGLWLHF